MLHPRFSWGLVGGYPLGFTNKLLGVKLCELSVSALWAFCLQCVVCIAWCFQAVCMKQHLFLNSICFCTVGLLSAVCCALLDVFKLCACSRIQWVMFLGNALMLLFFVDVVELHCLWQNFSHSHGLMLSSSVHVCAIFVKSLLWCPQWCSRLCLLVFLCAIATSDSIHPTCPVTQGGIYKPGWSCQ